MQYWTAITIVVSATIVLVGKQNHCDDFVAVYRMFIDIGNQPHLDIPGSAI